MQEFLDLFDNYQFLWIISGFAWVFGGFFLSIYLEKFDPKL